MWVGIFGVVALGVIFWPKSPQPEPVDDTVAKVSTVENPTEEPKEEPTAKPDSSEETIVEETEPTEKETIALPSKITDDYGIEMLLIPAGQFEMGEGANALTITLDNYYIDKYEVTNANYAECVNTGYCENSGASASLTRDSYYGNSQYSDYPVFVDLQDAQLYCEWRGSRLPTEAEWEKAARGTDGRTYPWGEWIDCNLASFSGCVDDTRAVGSYPNGISPYGVYDMAGNVWEWVYYEDASTLHIDPNDLILRGGSWWNEEEFLRVTSRVKYGPSIPIFSVGFRCAMSAAQP